MKVQVSKKIGKETVAVYHKPLKNELMWSFDYVKNTHFLSFSRSLHSKNEGFSINFIFSL